MKSELIEGLEDDEVVRLAAIGKRRPLKSGEYLFLLGDNAERLFVVSRGMIDLCFPLSFGGVIRDVKAESLSPGDTLGWSSLVKPYRFTMSARAAEDAEVIGFSRTDLSRLFEDSPHSGYAFTKKLCEIIARRFLNLQAVWARGLQRAVASGLGPDGVPGAALTPE